jgi:hypothetical protein
LKCLNQCCERRQVWSLPCPIYLRPGACNPIDPQTHPLTPPALSLCPLLLPSKNVFVLSIDAYGALVILFIMLHGTTRPAVGLIRVGQTQTDLVDSAFFKQAPYTHLAIHFVFLRASCQPFPLDEIISVRAHPSSLASSISSFLCKRGHTHPSWDTPLLTLRARQVNFPSSGVAGDSLHATFRA